MILTEREEKKNDRINAGLKELYDEYTSGFLSVWADAFGETAPCRMNEFGIIDTHRYRAENGILFIGRETNGWDDSAYEEGCLFRSWLCDISRNGIQGRGHISRHPNMWYNIGRWALLLQSGGTSPDDLAYQKAEAIDALGTIAFTNINKVRGKNKSGREYRKLADSDIAKELIRKEAAIMNPKIIVACGTWQEAASALSDYSGRLICMNHPGARKSPAVMIRELQAQLR
ncbi:MAG: hypothetical protein Q4C73_02835 [Eubacteriales bacterium]|nr:hypothetical protein [Eubacteriales bacterium]